MPARMVTARDIIAHVGEIASAFKVERIVLVGSYAYGTPTDDSDVDLLIVMKHRGPAHRVATRIRSLGDKPYGRDLLVRSPTEVAWRLRDGDMVMRMWMGKGLVLYDAVDRRVGEQGRRRLRRRLGATPVAQAATV
jgi:predicted nucleotidyltransferase